MPTYAIGDVQGCFCALQKLLKHIQFDAEQDYLWFTGDLVNRGTHSLEVLRFIKGLGDHAKTILGNHDLHLLACAMKQHPGFAEDTFQAIFAAPDFEELMDWLRQQPLFYFDPVSGYSLVHAGLAPQWDCDQALALSKEVEAVIQGDRAAEFFKNMYSDLPDLWNDSLEGWDRYRCLTNYFTRIRFCYPDGRLELSNKGPSDVPKERLVAWFRAPNRASEDLKIIFGHWAALGGITHTQNVYSLDTGCVWGFKLTAMRLEDGKRFGVDCESEDR